MKIVVTGGAGFIGSAIAKALLQDHEVVVLDNFSRGDRKMFDSYKAGAPQIFESDISDIGRLRELLVGAEVIIHCAAIAGIDSVVRSPVKTLEVNIFGTSNILTIAAQNPYLKRVVLFSTSEVYGRHAVNVSEGDDCIVSSPVEPRWSYAASKLVDEHLAFAYFRQHGLPVTVIRPFNIYGPGQLGEGAIKNFIDMALAGKALLIRGLPETVRSWCYITDLVEAVVGCINKQESVGEIFNIGNPSAVATTQALAELIRELSGNSEVEIQVDPRPHADVMYRVPNIKKAEKILEYFPKIGLREGITSVIDSRKAT